MRFNRAFVSILVGTGGASSAQVSSSSKLKSTDNEGSDSSVSPADEVNDIHESIRMDNGSIRDGTKNKKAMNSVWESKHLDPHGRNAIRKKEDLRFKHSPTKLKNQEKQEDDGEKKDALMESKNAAKEVKVETEEEKHEQKKKREEALMDYGFLRDDEKGNLDHYTYALTKDSAHYTTAAAAANAAVTVATTTNGALRSRNFYTTAAAASVSATSMTGDHHYSRAVDTAASDGDDSHYHVSLVQERHLQQSHEVYCENKCGRNRSTRVDNSNFKNSISGGFVSDIDCWITSDVTDMSFAFKDQNSFNDNISCWDVSRVTNMGSMFNGASAFNQPMEHWNVSKVNDMHTMFYKAKDFDQDVNDWNVSKVNDMGFMFSGAYYFNQTLNDWNVSKVNDMGCMFCNSDDFDQDVNDWDVSHVTLMSFMFSFAYSFNQCLSSWAEKTPEEVRTEMMFLGSACPIQSDPISSIGPWCQGEDENCNVILNFTPTINSPDKDLSSLVNVINVPSPNDNACVNNQGFEFIFTNKAGREIVKGGCEFVAKKPKKRCKKTIGDKKVKKECPEVCELPPKCSCQDKKFPFKVHLNGKITKLRCKNLKPSSKICNNAKVMDACPVRCKLLPDCLN